MAALIAPAEAQSANKKLIENKYKVPYIFKDLILSNAFSFNLINSDETHIIVFHGEYLLNVETKNGLAKIQEEYLCEFNKILEDIEGFSQEKKTRSIYLACAIATIECFTTKIHRGGGSTPAWELNYLLRRAEIFPLENSHVFNLWGHAASYPNVEEGINILMEEILDSQQFG